MGGKCKIYSEQNFFVFSPTYRTIVAQLRSSFVGLKRQQRQQDANLQERVIATKRVLAFGRSLAAKDASFVGVRGEEGRARSYWLFFSLFTLANCQ